MKDIKTLSRRKYPSQLYSLELRIQAWEDSGRMCHYCDRPLPSPGTKSGRRTHFDHKIALALGGSDDLTNLVVCCKVCNREKGKRTYEAFLRERKDQALKQVKRLSRLLAVHLNGN